jgi:hypothetical protein
MLRAEGTPEAQSRIENLQELVNAAAQAAASTRSASWSSTRTIPRERSIRTTS